MVDTSGLWRASAAMTSKGDGREVEKREKEAREISAERRSDVGKGKIPPPYGGGMVSLMSVWGTIPPL